MKLSGLEAIVLAGVLATAVSGCRPSQAPSPLVGDPDRGAVLIGRQACGACHEIPHIPRADGRVGPPLKGVGGRTIIAGYLPNTPDNLVRWIQSPQTIAPGNAMPNMGLSDRDARDIAAFLDTLR
jgi:cytochrome c2